MGQYIWKHHGEVEATYKLFNRNCNTLFNFAFKHPNILNKLKNEINHLKKLKFDYQQIDYLRSLKNSSGKNIFEEEYLRFLRDLNFQYFHFDINFINNQLEISYNHSWKVSIYFETLIMSIINEIFYNNYMEELNKNAYNKLVDYIEKYSYNKIIENIESLNINIEFFDFGSRRRSSKQTHYNIINYLMNKRIPMYKGSSNVYLSQKHKTRPIGTSAHELQMGICTNAITNNLNINDELIKCLNNWYEMYGYEYSIALTDTFTTDHYLNNLFNVKSNFENKTFAELYKGVRHDSGDPFEYTDKILNFYKNNNIKTTDKTIIYSDSLDVEKISSLYKEYNNVINIAFGWGTNLTNPYNIFEKSNIVVKLSEVNGFPTIKLSDDNDKSICNGDTRRAYLKLLNLK